MSQLTLEQVAKRTGTPIEQLRKQRMMVKALRELEPTTPRVDAPPEQPTPQFSPQGGPPKLQNELRKRGL